MIRTMELVGFLAILAGLVLGFGYSWALGGGIAFVGFIWFLMGRFANLPR